MLLINNFLACATKLYTNIGEGPTTPRVRQGRIRQEA